MTIALKYENKLDIIQIELPKISVLHFFYWVKNFGGWELEVVTSVKRTIPRSTGTSRTDSSAVSTILTNSRNSTEKQIN